MPNETTPNKVSTFNTACIYGATGTGKTMQIAAMALYIAERYGKRTRLISADGGGWGTIQRYIDAGFIEPLNLTTEPYPIPRLTQLSRGDWPNASGKYRTREQQGAAFSEVGMYAIEGFESICELLKAHLVEEKKKIGQDLATSFTEFNPDNQSEKFTYGSIGLAHYGWLQNNLIALIRGFQGLLTHGIEQVLFTSLCAVGEDDVRAIKVLGPSSAGKALTSSLPQRLGDLIYLDVAQIPAEGKNPARNEYRAYVTNKIDEVVRRAWPAKIRVPLSDLYKLKQANNTAGVQWNGNEGYLVLDEEGGRLDIKGVSRLWRWRDAQVGPTEAGLAALHDKFLGTAQLVLPSEFKATLPAESGAESSASPETSTVTNAGLPTEKYPSPKTGLTRTLPIPPARTTTVIKKVSK